MTDTKLIISGDWAAALGDREELRKICREIADTHADLAGIAMSVASWAETDLEVAAHYWGRLAIQLRGRVRVRARGTQPPVL